jgi:hypothetical protein
MVKLFSNINLIHDVNYTEANIDLDFIFSNFFYAFVTTEYERLSFKGVVH